METLTIPINETARILGVGRTKIYELVAKGRLKLVKIDRRSLITSASIEKFLMELIGEEGPTRD